MASQPILIWQASKLIAHCLVRSHYTFAACYPGSPTTIITDELEALSRRELLSFRYATNEKVALEMAAAHALAGGRAAAVMKHVGLNVALDAAMGVAYTGQRGALLLIVGDDPSCESSSSEQDSRLLARTLSIPCVEPSAAREVPGSVALATALSLETGCPVMLRVTTALCQSSAPVAYARASEPAAPKALAPPHRERRFLLLPAVSRENRVHGLARLEAARQLAADRKDVWEAAGGDGTGSAGGDGAGAAFGEAGSSAASAGAVGFVVQNAIHEPFRLACARLGLDPPTWRTRLAWPLAETTLLPFLRQHPEVVVVEELEPLLEEQAVLAAHRHGLLTRIRGADLFPRHGRLSVERLVPVLARIAGRPVDAADPVAEGPQLTLPPRPPTFCAGCPHTASFYAIKKVLDACAERPFIASDIGCYTLATKSGIEIGDVVLCMGASIGVATGTALTGRRSLALIGDSTFVHAGLPALRNAVDQGVDLLVTVLDNAGAAMTGGQPTGADLAAVARGLGAKTVEVVDPFDPASTEATFRRLLESPGVSVMVSASPCALTLADRRRRPRVNLEACTGCGDCVTLIHCPAISLSPERKFQVDVTSCVGCGLCSAICPEGALTPEPLPS